MGPTFQLGWTGAILASISCLAVAAPAGADTFKPTRLDDPPPGRCKPSDCSLREAFEAADERQDRDTIILGRGTYELDPAKSALFIHHRADIEGRGPNRTTIDGNGAPAVLVVLAGTDASSAVVRELAVTGGHSLIGGGGIYAGAKLTLDHVVVTGNEAAFGGGIQSLSPKLKLIDSAISGNSADEGAGLDVRQAPDGSVTVIRSSTISGNLAVKGAGILADRAAGVGPLPKVDLVNSTVAGNEADGEGGGIMADNGATVRLDNSTVAYNGADADGTGGGVGGGIRQHSGAIFEVNDSIVANNFVGASGAGEECDGDFKIRGGSVFRAQSSGDCEFNRFPEIVADAEIGLLGDYGGPTETVKLIPGSPAIRLAKSCPELDQRGVKRPKRHCDSGAFER